MQGADATTAFSVSSGATSGCNRLTMAQNEQTSSDIAEWQWDAGRARLSIDAPTGEYSDLSGEWSLPGMSVMLEGFSRSRLSDALAPGSGEISCGLILSNGRKVRLVGSFSNEGGDARGTLVPESGEPAADGASGLQPVYQPIISLADGRIVGFEALARWSGAGGDERLQDASLAAQMLESAASAVADWRGRSGFSNVFVHVNLTGRDLAKGETPGLIASLFEQHQLPPGALKVELTEQAALRDPDSAIDMAKAIKATGAELVLDDFGSGHSSFAWLADMPADGLKVDSDLIARLGNTRTDIILEAITLLGRRLGMSTTAEGVEDLATVTRLRSLGFDYAQGYAFGKPMSREQVVVFLMDYARPEED